MLLIFAVLIGISVQCAGAMPAVPYYASKYDHLDVDTILNNRRMVNYYSACLLSKGPCPPEGGELKRILPEALHSNCARCTEKQATVALRAITRLKKEYPKIWDQLSEKWDPDDIFIKKFESTFGLRTSPTKSSNVPSIVNRFSTDSEDEPTINNIDGSFSSATTARPSSVTSHSIITSTNSYQTSSMSSDKAKPALVSTTKKPTKPSKTYTPSSTTFKITTTTNGSGEVSTTESPNTARYTVSSTSSKVSSTRRPTIPGFVPINTFFTNPPVPLRPLIDLNIGANIGATVSGLVRGLGAIGTRVMETGADIAEVVIKNLSRPLRL